MRILLVADIVGGVRTYVAELTRALAAQGVEVHLALLGRERGFDRPPARSCEVRDLRLEWMEDPWADVEATAAWVESLLEHREPDVVHMNTFAPIRHPDVPVLLTVHSCVLTWWRAVHGRPAPPKWHRYRELAAHAIERADVVSAPTRALLDQLSAVYGPIPDARVIPNGREVSAAREPGGDRERLVVSVGRLWDDAKNAALLARAAPAIEGRVAVIGEGSVPDVERVGPVDEAEVLAWLSRAAVFAEPARYEPFGLSALEAALCGCALVLGDIPSLREVWGKAAMYVAPNDPGALAAAVNSLLGDPVRRRAAALQAHLSAGRYSPTTMAREYLEAYAELAAAAVTA